MIGKTRNGNHRLIKFNKHSYKEETTIGREHNYSGI